MNLRPLPEAARRLCEEVHAPPRLVAHLQLVHGVAAEITEALSRLFPDLKFDREAVLLGAATHDIGKSVHPEELTGPGKLHEAAGEKLLVEQGFPGSLTRFARTHGSWERDEGIHFEDLLVALADSTWKGVRKPDLEDRVSKAIAEKTGIEPWEVFTALDDLLNEIASRADERLAWQRRY